MKKRILTLFVALMMMAAMCLPLTAVAEDTAISADTMVVTIGSLSAKTGDEIVVPVTINKNPGIWGFNWELDYDSQVLRFDSIDFDPNGDFSELDFLDTTEKKYPVVIQGEGNDHTKNVTATGLVANIHFKVLVDADLGETTITLRLDDPGNNIDVDENKVPLVSNAAVVDVAKGVTSSSNTVDYKPDKSLQDLPQQLEEVTVASSSPEEVSEDKSDKKDAEKKDSRNRDHKKTAETTDDNTVFWIVIGVLGVAVIALISVIIANSVRRNRW